MYHIFKGFFALFVGITGIFGASTIVIEVADAPSATTTTQAMPKAPQAPSTTKVISTVPLPDFTGIDFGATYDLIAEQQRISRQLQIDEARMLHGKCGEWKQVALTIGWPEEEWPTLSEIMWRESKCDPLAWSGSDAGLLQINRIHTEWASMMGWSWPEDLFVAENNLLFSLRLWQESGWSPWRFSGPVPG